MRSLSKAITSWFRRWRTSWRSVPLQSRKTSQIRPPSVKERGSASSTGVRASPSVGLSSEDKHILELLIGRAWRFDRLPNPPFSLEVNNKSPDRILEAIYSHARRWAPGLDVPYAVPRLRFTANDLDSSGSFSVSENGWTTIEVALVLRGMSMALARVLAHEACHHILNHAGLDTRNNSRLNERRTELAMFVCGFGQLALDGDCEMNSAGFKCDPTLGYLRYDLMVHAESNVTGRLKALSPGSLKEAASLELEKQAQLLFNAPGQFERMLAGYQRIHQGSGKTELLHRMIEEYHRDRR